MLGNFITIDGVSSRTLGLFCKQLPMFPVAVQGYNTFTVGGRLDTLYQAANHYNDFQIDIEAVLIGFNVDPVIRWIQSGKKLVLSNQPDRYAEIKQLVAVDQKRVGNGALDLKITLKCGPFKYRLENSATQYASSPATFKTIGTFFSEPLIVAQGCSDGFTMSVNRTAISTSGLTGDIYFDIPNRVVYQIENSVKTVVLDHTSGRLWDIVLVPSELEDNAILFTGATKIVVTANERWL